MQTKASISPGYMARLVVVSIITLIGGFWFCYDGFIGYPHQQKVAQAYIQFQDEGRVDQWPAYAQERGWTAQPESPKSDSDIWLQRILGLAAMPVGLIFGIATLRSLGRCVTCDDDGISANKGKTIPFDAITKLDKSRWQKKGIVIVQYEHDGKKGHILLDDWKMHTENTEQILRMIEEKTGMGQPDSEVATDTPADAVVTS
ncbi:MAG TPA: hypothetical protein DER01_09010 [Phycisphaerales bacterium]|nr:hypothetical protein [Phycisphaerales bacterium]|tara:strand:+ start:142 stop:747 length:606 start_codon:yes stop_codon:yes gene_type:complete